MELSGYEDALLQIREALQDFLTAAEQAAAPRNAEAVRTDLKRLADALCSTLSQDGLELTLDFVYAREESEAQAASGPPASDPRTAPPSTDADYAALLALMEPHWEAEPLAQFNQRLLRWADDHRGSMERIDADCAAGTLPDSLTAAQRSFVLHTAALSGKENGRSVESLHTGSPVRPPVVEIRLPEKKLFTAERTAWADLQCAFSYEILDPETLTVGQRDSAVARLMEALVDYWQGLALDSALDMGEAGLAAALQDLAQELSGEDIAFCIDTDRLALDSMDERLESPA